MAIQRIETIDSTGKSFDLRSLFNNAKWVGLRSTESVYANASAESGKSALTADQSAVSSSALTTTDEGYYKYTVASTTNFITGQIVEVTTSADAHVDYFVLVEKTATTLTLDYANNFVKSGAPASGDKIIARVSWDTSKATLLIPATVQSYLNVKTASGSAELIMVSGATVKEVLDSLGATGSGSGCTTNPPVPISLSSGASISANTDVADFDCDYVDSAGFYVECSAGTSVDIVCHATIGTKEFNVSEAFFGSGVTAYTLLNGDSKHFTQTRAGDIQNWDSLRIEIQPAGTETYAFVGKLSMRY